MQKTWNNPNSIRLQTREKLHRAAIRWLALGVILALALQSCTPAPPSEPTDTPTAAAQITLPGTATAGSTTAAATLSASPAASATAVATAGGQPIALATDIPSATPTPTACPPPAGWVIYTIQAGDTLSLLAFLTGETVERLMAANCLSDDRLTAGETLYLPESLSQPAARLPQPPNVFTPRCSASNPFICSPGVELAALSFSDPGPVGGDPLEHFTPCNRTRATPWIHAKYSILDREIGQRTRFFACQFPNPDRLQASIRWSGGSEALAVSTELPNPDPYWSDPSLVRKWQAVAVWYPICDGRYPVSQPGQPRQEYTVTMWDIDDPDQKAELTFALIPSMQERLLAVPETTLPGGEFDVWLCGFQPDQAVSLSFYSLAVKGKNSLGFWEYTPRKAHEWVEQVNPSGWKKFELSSSLNAPQSMYMLETVNSTSQFIRDILWLTPEW